MTISTETITANIKEIGDIDQLIDGFGDWLDTRYLLYYVLEETMLRKILNSDSRLLFYNMFGR